MFHSLTFKHIYFISVWRYMYWIGLLVSNIILLSHIQTHIFHFSMEIGLLVSNIILLSHIQTHIFHFSMEVHVWKSDIRFVSLFFSNTLYFEVLERKHLYFKTNTIWGIGKVIESNILYHVLSKVV